MKSQASSEIVALDTQDAQTSAYPAEDSQGGTESRLLEVDSLGEKNFSMADIRSAMNYDRAEFGENTYEDKNETILINDPAKNDQSNRENPNNSSRLSNVHPISSLLQSQQTLTRINARSHSTLECDLDSITASNFDTNEVSLELERFTTAKEINKINDEMDQGPKAFCDQREHEEQDRSMFRANTRRAFKTATDSGIIRESKQDLKCCDSFIDMSVHGKNPNSCQISDQNNREESVNKWGFKKQVKRSANFDLDESSSNIDESRTSSQTNKRLSTDPRRRHDTPRNVSQRQTAKILMSREDDLGSTSVKRILLLSEPQSFLADDIHTLRHYIYTSHRRGHHAIPDQMFTCVIGWM
ncbi:hypothetical protein QAD02_002137 [Eretmocerus hayati]|uniref:Uncharacterized protein n=1 Tax=Eretmocerus hayati TaxID=131215 RepID=A0ACC2NJ86_9HYME|nr:hypothetical protein QAD02_002137 [Eretmocerus hayati]